MAKRSICLTVTDSKTGRAPANVQVWANQVLQPGLQFSFPTDQPVYLYLKSDGYIDRKWTVAALPPAPVLQFDDSYSRINIPIALDPTPPVISGDVTVRLTNQGLPGISLEFTTISRSAIAVEGKAVFKDVPNGHYGIKASYPGYEDRIELCDVHGDTTVEITMTPVADGEAQEGDTSASPSPDENFDAASAAGGAVTLDTDVSEQIYGNSAFDGYFTSAQARVYVGNLFLDELQSIQYAVQSNVIPVYGYASKFADAWGEGRSMVQGQLVFNYVSEAYVFTILDGYRRMMSLPAEGDAAVQDGQSLAQTLQSRQAAIASGGVVGRSLDNRIDTFASSPEAVRAAKKLMRAQGFDPVYLNATYQNIVFDIIVEIGTGSNRTYRKLEKCRFVSNEQILDQSGQVIGDAYGFIARRLR